MNYWISYVGERWRGFKSQLRHDYIRKPKPSLWRPTVIYNYIDEDIWEKFVKSRSPTELLVSSNLFF